MKQFGRGLSRNPEVDPVRRNRPRHHADDRIALALEEETLADDVGATLIPALPEMITDDGSCRTHGDLVVGRDGATDRGTHAVHREESRRRPPRRESLGNVAARPGDVPGAAPGAAPSTCPGPAAACPRRGRAQACSSGT